MCSVDALNLHILVQFTGSSAACIVLLVVKVLNFLLNL